jgi:hypothetical protein
MHDDRDLVNQLLTRAGMAMEDAHSAAIVDDGESTMVERIAVVQQAGRIVTLLADAAALVMQLGTLHP